jgi:hypothetical protein
MGVILPVEGAEEEGKIDSKIMTPNRNTQRGAR